LEKVGWRPALKEMINAVSIRRGGGGGGGGLPFTSLIALLLLLAHRRGKTRPA
jgi:hypothetical protein